MRRSDVYAAIDAEREAQQRKWGGFHGWGHGDCSGWGITETTKMTVLAEEVGEVARTVLDRTPDRLRAELVQVAAVAVAWLESL